MAHRKFEQLERCSVAFLQKKRASRRSTKGTHAKDVEPRNSFPEIIGDAFVTQFYSILHEDPQAVHRFYQDTCTMSRPSCDDSLTTVTTMKGINDLIISFNYKNYKTEIMTTVAQASYMDGVTVLVTGCLISKDSMRRKFTESFFLAPQRNGYYCLNDAFRFIEEDTLPTLTLPEREESVMEAQTDVVETRDSFPGIVGTAFVCQFFYILHHTPELIHRFYQDTSTMSRPAHDGSLTSVTTMKGINDLILSLNFKDYKAEILTTDTQASYMDGLAVLVTGCLTGKDNMRRKFTESFFLAPQSNGYYCLNDAFRFIEEDTLPVVASPEVEESSVLAALHVLRPKHQALEVLLDLSGSSIGPSGCDKNSTFTGSGGEDTKHSGVSYELKYRSYSTSQMSESELRDNGCPVNCYDRHPRVHDSRVVNWKNAVQKLESFAKMRHELYPLGTSIPLQNTHVKGDEYQEFREPATHLWNSMKEYKKQAKMAYSNGSKEKAAFFSDKAKQYGKLAREEDERESMKIFEERNKDQRNILTIDLHGQYVETAMKLVKLHLLFGTCISCYGSGGVGKSKIKPSVINLLEKEGIKWREENKGMIVIELQGPREFSFLASKSDSE